MAYMNYFLIKYTTTLEFTFHKWFILLEWVDTLSFDHAGDISSKMKVWESEYWLALNDKLFLFWLYHGENKLHFDKMMMMMSSLY